MTPPSAETPAALVTGGEGDLGKAVRAELESRGLVVFAPGRSELDVSDPEAVAKFVGALPRIDLLVHCAGILRDRMLSGTPENDEATRQILKFAADGQADFTASTVRALEQLAFQLVLTCTAIDDDMNAILNHPHYAQVFGDVKEYGARNVRVNCVLPGLLETKMTAHLSPEVLDAVRAAHTLRRFNTCAEAAKFIGFLHGDLPHTSGQVFQLDSRVNRWT